MEALYYIRQKCCCVILTRRSSEISMEDLGTEAIGFVDWKQLV